MAIPVPRSSYAVRMLLAPELEPCSNWSRRESGRPEIGCGLATHSLLLPPLGVIEARAHGGTAVPVRHAVDHERREMRTMADGPITMDDIRRHLTQEHRDKGLAYRELIEASGVTVEFSSSDVRTMVEILRAYGQEGVLGPTAIVVGNDLAYGMVRMLAILLEGVCSLQPFRTRQEAEQWLADASFSRSPSATERASEPGVAADPRSDRRPV
jgi:hypothetical protein